MDPLHAWVDNLHFPVVCIQSLPILAPLHLFRIQSVMFELHPQNVHLSKCGSVHHSRLHFPSFNKTLQAPGRPTACEITSGAPQCASTKPIAMQPLSLWSTYVSGVQTPIVSIPGSRVGHYSGPRRGSRGKNLDTHLRRIWGSILFDPVQPNITSRVPLQAPEMPC